jgi:hypothetical protein
VAERPDENALYLTLSSTNLVELLVSTGLCRGNKIHQQIDVPGWALVKNELARACIRGLVDTDGSLYCHGHLVRGRYYQNIGLVFTSHSRPLLLTVHRVLNEAGLPARCDNRAHVSIYRQAGVARYLEVFGTSNLKHAQKYDRWTRRGDRAAEGAALEMPCMGNPCAAGSNPAPSATLNATWPC